MRTRNKYRLEPAEQAAAETYFGEQPYRYTGFILTASDEPVALAGVYRVCGALMAFSTIRRMNRRAIAAGAIMFKKYLDQLKEPVYAVPDKNIKQSWYNLTKLGFAPTGERIDEAELLVRHPCR